MEQIHLINKNGIRKLFDAAHLTDTEQAVLTWLLDHISQIRSAGIQQVAHECYTSTSSIIRLAKKLGYSGWSEMSFELSRLNGASELQTAGLDKEHVHFSYQSGELQLFCNSLEKTNVILLSGEGYSRISTEYMERKLVGLGYCALMQDFLETNQLISAFDTCSRLSILVSKSGQTKAVVDMARECNRSQILTCAFTGNAKSDLAQMCDIVFTVPDEHPFDMANAQVNRFTGYCIVAFEELLSFAQALKS